MPVRHPLPRTAALLAELESHPPAHRHLLLSCTRFARPALAEELIAGAEASRSTPRVMAERAALAVRLAESLRLRALLTAARTTLANAHRLLGDLGAADAELAKAMTFRPRGALGLRARSVLASLRFDQWRLDEALAVLKSIEPVARRRRDARELAICLLQQAIIHGEDGRPCRALDLLTEAAAVVDRLGDGKLALKILHNMARCELERGRLDRALKLTLAARRAYAVSGDSAIRIKLAWLRGQILAAMGQHEAAIVLFRRSQVQLAAQGNAQEAAMACLDLAASFMALGNLPEVRRFARDGARLAATAGAEPAALAALSLLRSAPEPELGARLVVAACAQLKIRRHLAA
jgi:tetratricopeptide (TPR) repeat protein